MWLGAAGLTWASDSSAGLCASSLKRLAGLAGLQPQLKRREPEPAAAVAGSTGAGEGLQGDAGPLPAPACPAPRQAQAQAPAALHGRAAAIPPAARPEALPAVHQGRGAHPTCSCAGGCLGLRLTWRAPQVLDLQLAALRDNNQPYIDHGTNCAARRGHTVQGHRPKRPGTQGLSCATPLPALTPGRARCTLGEPTSKFGAQGSAGAVAGDPVQCTRACSAHAGHAAGPSWTWASSSASGGSSTTGGSGCC